VFGDAVVLGDVVLGDDVEFGARRAAALLRRNRREAVVLGRVRRAPVLFGENPVELGDAVELTDAVLLPGMYSKSRKQPEHGSGSSRLNSRQIRFIRRIDNLRRQHGCAIFEDTTIPPRQQAALFFIVLHLAFIECCCPAS
jgi:hypothetical protein